MRQSLTFERWYPAIWAGFTLALAFLLDFSLPADSRKELLSATISVGAILAGFLGTAKAILMALPQPLMDKLRNSKYLVELARYLSAALFGSLAISAVGVLGFFTVTTRFDAIYSAVWLGLFTYAGLSFWRVSRIMLIILQTDPKNL